MTQKTIGQILVKYRKRFQIFQIPEYQKQEETFLTYYTKQKLYIVAADLTLKHPSSFGWSHIANISNLKKKESEKKIMSAAFTSR